jgi:hypothetical protein
MARPNLPAERLKAGEKYLASLRSLGLHPHFLGWGWEKAVKQWVLVLVTSIVDAGGPLALNRLLFAAYNASATPRDISPFVVRVYSPDIVPELLFLLMDREFHVTGRDGRKRGTVSGKLEPVTFHGVEHAAENTYSTPRRRARDFHARRGEWQRFKANVERLAA